MYECGRQLAQLEKGTKGVKFMENGFGRIFYDFTQDGWSQNLCTFLLLFLRGSRTGGEG